MRRRSRTALGSCRPDPPRPNPHPCLPRSAKDAQRAEMESGEGGGPQVTDQDIANIVAQWTGIPIEKVSSDETERLVKMEEVLHGRVIGQVRGGARRAGCSHALAGSRGVFFTAAPVEEGCIGCVFTAAPVQECFCACVTTGRAVHIVCRVKRMHAPLSRPAGGGCDRHLPRHPPRARGPEEPQPPHRVLHLLG